MSTLISSGLNTSSQRSTANLPPLSVFPAVSALSQTTRHRSSSVSVMNSPRRARALGNCPEPKAPVHADENEHIFHEALERRPETNKQNLGSPLHPDGACPLEDGHRVVGYLLVGRTRRQVPSVEQAHRRKKVQAVDVNEVRE